MRTENELDDLRESIQALTRQISAIATHQDRMNEITMLLLARLGDATHLSIAQAAEYKKVPVKTIRRWIRERKLTLEAEPGSQKMGIPIQQLYDRWIDIRVLRAARERERSPGQKKDPSTR